jgi:hypothetical protein
MGKKLTKIHESQHISIGKDWLLELLSRSKSAMFVLVPNQLRKCQAEHCLDSLRASLLAMKKIIKFPHHGVFSPLSFKQFVNLVA